MATFTMEVEEPPIRSNHREKLKKMGAFVICTFILVVEAFSWGNGLFLDLASILSRWTILIASFSYLTIPNCFFLNKKMVEAMFLGILWSCSVFWITNQSFMENISLLQSLNTSWFRAFLPAFIILVGGNTIGFFFNFFSWMLWIIASICALYSPTEESAHVYSFPIISIILFDQFLLCVLLMYHNYCTEKIYQQAVNAGTIAKEANNTKTLFMAKMSHDLRTPLNGLLGFLHELLETEIAPLHREMLNVVQFCAKNLERLIVDLLDVSLIEMGKINIINSIFEFRKDFSFLEAVAKGLSKDEQKISFNIDSNLPELAIGDSVRVNQIFINLINNALKFTPKGGCISVDVKANQCEDAKRSRIDFAVTDSGIGIPQVAIPKLFEPFFQCQNEFALIGTGLGLFITKTLLTAMNGDIFCSSKEGEGTTFSGFFFLGNVQRYPLVSNQSLIRRRSIEAPKQESQVLVVEDNLINLKLIERLLDKSGVKYTSTKNGLEGFEKYKELHKSLRLVLMDIQMPVMNGIESSQKIRQFEMENNLKRIPIVAVTAGVMENETKAIFEVGIDQIIPKPVKHEKIMSVVYQNTK